MSDQGRGSSCGPECNGTWPDGRPFHVKDCPNATGRVSSLPAGQKRLSGRRFRSARRASRSGGQTMADNEVEVAMSGSETRVCVCACGARVSFGPLGGRCAFCGNEFEGAPAHQPDAFSTTKYARTSLTSGHACQWCGRAIVPAGCHDDCWQAAKGTDPLPCDANHDDGRHEPHATGTYPLLQEDRNE